MFICCNKSLCVREGGEVLSLGKGFIGNIDDRWAAHWYIRAAMADGTIVANEGPAAKKEPGPRKGPKAE